MAEIELRRPGRSGLFALVDDADVLMVRGLKWHAHLDHNTWYAVARSGVDRPKAISMHRLILNAPDGVEVDHRNGNGLDNQRGNLRLATPRQNQRNRHAARGSSGYKGVHWHTARARWRAQIRVNGRSLHVGYFIDEVEAARAYDAAALRHFGEFAAPNFPEATIAAVCAPLTVYVSGPRSLAYHRFPECAAAGRHAPSVVERIDVATAEASGLVPCKKCYRAIAAAALRRLGVGEREGA